MTRHPWWKLFSSSVPRVLDVTALLTGNSEKLDRNSGAENLMNLYKFLEKTIICLHFIN